MAGGLIVVWDFSFTFTNGRPDRFMSSLKFDEFGEVMFDFRKELIFL